jgi:2-polyprenyl-3-methyl-5-hydroxy-6-metoxy-1,4-benzoquinol methylase
MVSSRRAFEGLELLADPQGEAFIKRSSLYERHLEPFCRIMDEQIRNKTALGTNEIFRNYAHIIRWPIRKLEYSFVLHHALPLMEEGQRPRTLEAGCGATPFPHLFAMMGAEVDAVDFNEDLIERLRMAKVDELYGFPVHHQWMDLRRLAFPDSTFDLVTCVSVI